MRQIDIFLRISDAQQCWFTCFVRHVNLKLFCRSANQNKNNFRFPTLKNTQIIKQTDLLFWKNWRKYGAVSYLFNCIWNYKFLTIKLFSHSNHLFYYVSVSTQWCVFYNWNNKSAWNFATIAKKMCDLAKINFFLCWISFYNSYFWYILGGFLICVRTL